MDEDDIPSIFYPDLKAWGIPWCYDHLMRLVRAGKFPKPRELSPRKHAWTPRQIREWLEGLWPNGVGEPDKEIPGKDGDEKLPGKAADKKGRKGSDPDPVPDPVPEP